MNKREIIVSLILITLFAVTLYLVGCNGNSANVKPNNDMETSLKNQQKMTEKIDAVGGDLVKIQKNVSNIEYKVDQTFETLQGSVKTGDVDGGVHTSQDTNSIWYGLGLVAIVLIFALILIWLMAKAVKGLIGKILK